VPVANQAVRAQAYIYYVSGASHHPQIVGTHWFQYQDEPTTGRSYDEKKLSDRICECGRHALRKRRPQIFSCATCLVSSRATDDRNVRRKCFFSGEHPLNAASQKSTQTGLRRV
jgi:hypothetical protein